MKRLLTIVAALAISSVVGLAQAGRAADLSMFGVKQTVSTTR